MLQAALARWRELIGDEHVWADETRLAAAATATFPTQQRVAAQLRPADTSQVQACVRVAHELGIPLHAVSRGRNWGYGSRVPHRDGAVVLDLARLDRIVDFDERLAYVTVEPGVTFRQLSTFLRSCRARVFASVVGGTGDGSVLANALERGDGSGPLGDRFGHVCGLEVVLPTGELVHTGYARFPGAHAAPLSKWGAGPYLDGLFSQSGLGIVTRATIWLAPYPKSLLIGSLIADDDAALRAIVDAARELVLSGAIVSTVPMWNDYKLLALVGQYPWTEAGERTPLPDDVREALRARAKLGRWNATFSIYGASRAHALASRTLVTEAFGRVGQLAWREGPSDPLAAEADACGPVLGVPRERNVSALYWRKRMPFPERVDPERDRCGFIWLSHAVPFEGQHARTVARLVEDEVRAAGFEPQLSLLGVTARCMSMVCSIAYDRDAPGDDDRALACHAHVSSLLVARGYPPFRTGVQDTPPSGEPAYDELVARIANAIDPHGILARR